MQLQFVTKYGKIVPNYARKNIFMVITSSVTPQEDPKSVPLYSYVNQKWPFLVITHWSTTQRNTTQWSTTQHNRAQHNNGHNTTAWHNTTTGTTQQLSTTQRSTAEHSTTQRSTAQQSKIHCQYACSGGFVNHGTRDLLWCELALSLCTSRKPLGNDGMHIRVKCRRFVCDFSSNMTVGPVSSSSEDILKSRELRFACIHKEPWVNCSQTCVNIVDHVSSGWRDLNLGPKVLAGC